MCQPFQVHDEDIKKKCDRITIITMKIIKNVISWSNTLNTLVTKKTNFVEVNLQMHEV